MSQSTPLRLGFVGAGSMGQCAHLKHYAALDDCRVVALVEPRPQIAEDVARRYGVKHVYASAREMLDAHELDALVAPQQFAYHGSIIAPLYEAGLPIMTEKPLAGSVETGEAMLRALKKSGARHFVGYHKRGYLATTRAKEEIGKWQCSGEMGQMRYVRLTMPPGDWISGGFDDLIRSDEPFPPGEPDAPPPNMSAPEFEAYLTFVNYYIHQVNLLRFLLGEEYSVRYAGPSGVLLVAQSASGVAGVTEMAPYATKEGWHETALIGFERGTIKIELPAPLMNQRAGRVEIYDGEKTVVPVLPPVGAMRAQAMNFLRAVRGEETVLCEAAEALRDLELARDYVRLR